LPNSWPKFIQRQVVLWRAKKPRAGATGLGSIRKPRAAAIKPPSQTRPALAPTPVPFLTDASEIEQTKSVKYESSCGLRDGRPWAGSLIFSSVRPRAHP
jgi:hypothetical protein